MLNINYKLLQSIVLIIIFILVLHVTFKHNLIRNCKLYKQFLPLIVKELSILNHSSSLETPTILKQFNQFLV